MKKTGETRETRFEKRFSELRSAGRHAFVPFVVLGDPDFETSLEIIRTLIASGADALELGFAFSDPIADGPVIQEADQRALASGMDTDRNFELLKKIRLLDAEIPISLLIYSNLILQFGIDRFYKNCAECGVDAVLASDVPVEESKPFLACAKKFGVHQIFLVTPNETESRLKKILAVSNGYVYVVAVLGVTGARENVQSVAKGLLQKLAKKTRLPLLVGFGISKPEHVREIIASGADGAIVGSAIVRKIGENLSDREMLLRELKKFASSLKSASL
ncbi:MAG: tryptophan synthase subunit alpha [Candidatus Diapherotrites archaeon]|nr:tryptophan synthase subunit alpha [Candidatus Diapherotrites archaeon]